MVTHAGLLRFARKMRYHPSTRSQFGRCRNENLSGLGGIMIFARMLAAFILAAGLLAGGPASAQAYPTRPITILVPFAPGGATDAITRIIQDSMAKSLGQPIVVENVGGAGGMICAARAARAEPDGHTIMIHQVALAAGVALYPNLSFDAERDFVPIGLINTAASTLPPRARPRPPPPRQRPPPARAPSRSHAPSRRPGRWETYFKVYKAEAA